VPATAREEAPSPIAPVAPVLEAVREPVEPTVLAAGIFHVAVAGIGMPSEEERGATTDRAHAAAAAAVPPA
jgi:hypothetical protein